MPGGERRTGTDRYLPNTIHQAIMLLVFYLSASDKKKITSLTEDDLADLDFSLGWFIKNEFKLVTNDALRESCRVTSGENTGQADQASGIIIKALWKRLKMLHYQDFIR
jgi:hypothetical protein